MGKKDSAAPAERVTTFDAIFDHALEAAGLDPRADEESVQDYVGRKTWGPNTRRHLENAAKAAEMLDRAHVLTSVQSARQHHDDPNPPDTGRLKP